jgi:hypothetical protein
MVPFIAHIELKCIMVAIKEDNWQCENCQYIEYCLLSLLENGGCNSVVDVAEFTEFGERCPSSNVAMTPIF